MRFSASCVTAVRVLEWLVPAVPAELACRQPPTCQDWGPSFLAGNMIITRGKPALRWYPVR